MADEQTYGFLSLIQTEAKDGYIGAILVIDALGRPLEFRVTYPVKPNLVQRTLYGDTLEPYIAIELCGKPLLKAIERKPQLLVVSAEFLIGLRAGTTNPIVFIQKAGAAIEVSTAGGEQQRRQTTRLEAQDGRFQPVILTTAPEFPDDATQARQLCEPLFSKLDLTEPIERIANAVRVLAAQDKRYQ